MQTNKTEKFTDKTFVNQQLTELCAQAAEPVESAILPQQNQSLSTRLGTRCDCGKTPAPALMQDDHRGLFRWFASRPDLRRLVRLACSYRTEVDWVGCRLSD